MNDGFVLWVVVIVWVFVYMLSEFIGESRKKIECDLCALKMGVVFIIVLYFDDKYLKFVV